MIATTPGVSLLATGALRYVLPNILLSLSLRAAFTFSSGITVKLWPALCVGLSLLPICLAVVYIVKERKDQSDANTKGCQLVPRIRGRWPANLDVLKKFFQGWNRDYPGEEVREFLDAYGPIFDMHPLFENLVFTTCPEHVKAILASDFERFEKGPELRSCVESLLGTGVFGTDGDMWKFHRSLTRPFFSRERVSDFEVFDRHSDAAILRLKERMRSGGAIDFQDLMSRFTLDTATDFLFGSCVHSLRGRLPLSHNSSVTHDLHDVTEASSEVADRFADAFMRAQEVIGGRLRKGWAWPIDEIFTDKTREPMRVVNAFVEPIVKAALEKHHKAVPMGNRKAIDEEESIAEGETLLDHLVKVTQDPVVVKDETLNILLAGRDTTAATLTFVVYFLAMYPDIAGRLRKEILGQVGLTKRPESEDIRAMKYLRAVINETLRLYPIVPFNMRTAIKATTWDPIKPGDKPYHIPEGTKAAYSVFAMHRRKDLWGPDAEEFDPDRFIDGRLQKYLLANPFIFLPFNAGPRICLGQQFAYNEVSFMVVRLMQQFKSFSLELDAWPPETRPDPGWARATGRQSIEKFWPKIHLTMYSWGGLWVKMDEQESVQ